MKCPIDCPMIATKDIIPTPAISPVVTLKKLLLSLLKKACVQPSMYVGRINAKVHQMFNENIWNKKNGNAI